MNYQDTLISDLAKRECESLCRKVIQSLTKMTDGMQSGADTPLKNIWEEICVQVQGEQSVMWGAYLDTIESLILGEVTKLDKATKHAIWLQTDEGTDWRWDNEDNQDQEGPIFYEGDIAEYILHRFVLSAAADWTNKRTEKYLEKGIDE